MTEVFRTVFLPPLGIRKRVPKGTQLILGRGVVWGRAWRLKSTPLYFLRPYVKHQPDTVCSAYALQVMGHAPGQSCVVQGCSASHIQSFKIRYEVYELRANRKESSQKEKLIIFR